MKYLAFLFIFLLNFECLAQSEVLLVGVTHAYPDRSPKRFQWVYQQVLEFKPAIIATEFLPVNSLNTVFILGGKKLQKKVEELSEKSGVSEAKRQRKIDEYLSMKERSLHQQIKLCGLLYAQYDLANFYFQFYQLFKEIGKLKVNQQRQWLAETEKYLFTQSENLTIAHQLLESEFGNLIFPLARQLEIKKVYGVDNQDVYRESRKATFKSDKKLKKKLKLDDRELRSHLWGRYDTLDNTAMEQMTELMYLNSLLHDSLVIEAFEKIKRIDSSKYSEKRLKYWAYRNEKIAENIKNLGVNHAVKKIVVFLGANHIPFVKQYLEKEENMNLNVIRLKK